MKQYVIALATLVYASQLAAQNPNPSPVVDAAITSIMDAQKLPGSSTVIVKGWEVVWLESYGYANTDLETPFTDTTSLMLASVSKVFTGVALMQLVDQGILSLAGAINEHLPFEVFIPGHEEVPITFHMLLTHTSSITDNWNAMDGYYNDLGDPTMSLADCMERYFSTSGADYSATANFQSQAPGTVYTYSNMATALTGYLVELITGMPFHAYCNQHIFAPLCMDNTRWFLSEYPTLNALANPHDYFSSQYQPIDHYGFADYPNGMLRSNAADLAHFMISMLQGGGFNTEELMSPGLVLLMFLAQVPGLEPTQGLQFYTEDFDVSGGTVTLWGHSGAEYGIDTHMYFDFDNEMAVAVLANGDNDASEIVEVLYDYGLELVPFNLGYPECEPISQVHAHDPLQAFQVYPVPARSWVTFVGADVRAGQQELTISDLAGKQVLSVAMADNRKDVNVSGLANGLYLYTIRANNEVVGTGKLVVGR